jgi:hypothetical protein
MTAKIILDLTLEEAAAITHLIMNSSHDDLVKKAMSPHRAELLKRIGFSMPAFDPPGRDNMTR